MKKIFLMTLLTIVLMNSSCKKDYVCNCTISDNNFINLHMPDTKRSVARKECSAMKEYYSFWGYDCNLNVE